MFGRKKRKPEKPVEIDLPITPMLDMSFQLMAFFVFTFKPTPQEGQIAFQLPREEATTTNLANPLPDFLPDDKAEEYTVLVGPGSGSIGSLSVRSAGAVTTIEGESEDQRLKGLFDNLSAIPKPKEADRKGPSLKIECAKDLKYSEFMRLMDLCRKAGFDNVGIGLTKPENGIKQ